MQEKTIFKVSKNTLLHSLQNVSKVVSDKSTIPVYTTIMFKVEDKKLFLTGSNQEIQIETSLELVEASNPVKFCMDKAVIGILKTLSEQPLTVEVIKTTGEKKVVTINVNIIHASGNIEIQAMDAVDFTKMVEPDGKTFTIPVENLKRGLDKTRKFAQTDPSYPTASAVYIDVLPDKLVFVATNNKVVSVFKDLSLIGIDANSFIFGIAAVNITAPLLNETTEELAVITSRKGSISINIGDITITSRLVEGNYVNYNSVIPTENPVNFTTESKQLSNTVSRLLAASDNVVGLIRIEADSEKVNLSTKDEYFNKSANENISAICDGAITIGAKGSHLEDMLSVIDGNVTLSFSVPERPIILTPETNEDQTELTMLAMPLSLQ